MGLTATLEMPVITRRRMSDGALATLLCVLLSPLAIGTGVGAAALTASTPRPSVPSAAVPPLTLATPPSPAPPTTAAVKPTPRMRLRTATIRPPAPPSVFTQNTRAIPQTTVGATDKPSATPTTTTSVSAPPGTPPPRSPESGLVPTR